MFKLDFISFVDRSSSNKRNTLHFKYAFDDCSYFGYVSSWLPNNKINRLILIDYKTENECNYVHSEYDCNGSTEKKIKIETDKKHNKIRLKVHVSVDC